MAFVAVIAAILIVIATIYYVSGREDAFNRQMTEADTLASVRFPRVAGSDSIQLGQYRGRYLLLDFWADWSDHSKESHKLLSDIARSNADSLAVVAASVHTDSSVVTEYRRSMDYPFVFVEGTAFYDRWKLPGIPSQILFDPNGEVIDTYVGYTDSTHYDTLKTLIR